jgi:hypothetical protein
VVISITVFVVLRFRRRAGNYHSHVEEIDPDPRPFISNRKRIYTIKTNYVTYISHSDLPDLQSSSALVEQISSLSTLPLEVTATPQVTRPLAQTPAPPSKLIVLNPPTDGLTSLVPPASTSHPTQVSGSSIHPAMSQTSTITLPFGLSTNQSTDEEAALLLRLCNLQVPTADISRVIAAMRGHSESTIEEGHLLWRLHGLNVPREDINLIVDAMRSHIQHSGTVGNDHAGAPPPYDFTRS